MPRSAKFLIFAVLFNAFGCDTEAQPLDDAASLDATDVIVENLLAAGFPASEIEIDEAGQVLAGGDAVVTLEASYELAGAEAVHAGEGFRQYRTTNVVTVDDICINGAEFTGDLSTALDQAIENYEDEGLGFRMWRTDGSSPSYCDVTITARKYAGTAGKAGFPSNGNPYTQFYIGYDILPTFGLDVARHVIMHELGHCIGFRHTDFFDRSISCGGAASNEGGAMVGRHHIPNTPTGAVVDGSVMNACYNEGSSGEWTESDIIALHSFYGSFCDAYDGLTIALYTKHDRYVTAEGSGDDWKLRQETTLSAKTSFDVVCHDDKPSLYTSQNRYVWPKDSSADYKVRQSTSYSSSLDLTPRRQSDGTWTFMTTYAKYLRAPGEGENWRISQDKDLTDSTRFEIIVQP